MIFLDTSAVIANLRGDPNIAKYFAENKNNIFAIPIPVLYEIYYGFYFAPLSRGFRNDKTFLARLRKEEKVLIRFLNDIEIFNMDLEAAKKAAELSAILDSKGKSIGKMDILIASIVLSNGHNEIVTKDESHFLRITGLKVYTF